MCVFVNFQRRKLTSMAFQRPLSPWGPTGNFYGNGQQVMNLIKRLTLSPADRAEALVTLSQHRESIPDLAVQLWESSSTITALLSEILSIFPHLTSAHVVSHTTPTSLTGKHAGRVCNALALFQCIAGHNETRMSFIKANIPVYLFPFLHTTNQSRECECLKVTALGIIGSLVKAEEPQIIKYLLDNEFVPLCLRILKFGQELSRIVAAFVVQKIVSDNGGRQNICSSRERLDTVVGVLLLVITDLMTNYSHNLAKNIMQAFEVLLRVPTTREALNRHAAPLDKLKRAQATPSPKCDESFLVFVNKIVS